MSSNQIHIAHVVYSFATGGLENGMVNLINHLPEDQYFHSIVCITDHDAEFLQRITTTNFKIYDLEKSPGHGLSWLFRCWKLLRQLKPDICHSRNLNPLEAQLAAFMAGVKVRIHGEHGWDINDLGGSNTKYQKLRRLLKPFISHFIALSSEAKQYLHNKIGVRSEKISQICNGVNVEKFSTENRPAVLPENFASQGSIVFGTVGRLAAVKNQTQLLEAFLKLWSAEDKYKDTIKLIIVGDGELMPELERLVEDYNAQQVVWLAGLRKDIPELMAAMDVFVLPSLAEGISNTILEAMASGLPVVATNVGGTSDLIFPQHQTTHLVDANNVVALADGLNIYASQPERASDEQAMIRDYCVENFSIEHMVQSYHSVYQQTAGK
ncbi:TIGR03088 family PEP-CTERM/XrtA system glycosyltransferase [Thalassotalea sp. M1531]|uniref:TIGR03088 family PEP-CTERM/XrtA system glycosyltransferase n=1 Tax=Thalassotalea algicola TaxID=2716224 RepID=A0A7Y0Q9C2_9GAMM|nr:TIGR03088 family PEP-CTERM/XrtA system glycosyltransferase [Thalassotalea algicola]NMP33065.1 TIGR03088 family PEP-CTERM/XrtA system glycosyltransferase [Thalassotalea algicola]